jgi:citrate synthase
MQSPSILIDSINVKNWMTQEEACELLGVRKQTLYAYVSRGQIEVRGDPEHANRNLYRGSDIAALLKKRNTGRARKNIAASTMAWGEPIINTHISTIVRGRLFYRGKDAVQLASTATLEEAAQCLWDAAALPRFPSVEPIAIGGPKKARVYAAMGMAAGDHAAGPIPSFDALCAEGAALIGLFASNTIDLPSSDEALHVRIAQAWRAERHADLIRRVLVMLADQELSSSAFAARVTASTGATLGASLLAGLAAFSGPMHGNAIMRVRELLDDAARLGTEHAVRKWLSAGRPLAGFGHELYPQGDPRAAGLLSAFEPPAQARELIECVERITGTKPTIDIVLAAIVEYCALPEDAAFALFSIARSVGWVAHSIEQMMSGNLLRPRAHYVGPAVAGSEEA